MGQAPQKPWIQNFTMQLDSIVIVIWLNNTDMFLIWDCIHDISFCVTSVLLKVTSACKQNTGKHPVNPQEPRIISAVQQTVLKDYVTNF